MTNIHKHIKSCRIECNMTQEQLAEKIFTTRQAVSSYETGRTSPSIEMLQLLANAFNVSIETLIYGDSVKEKRNRLNRSIFICLGLFLVLVLISSAALCLLNRCLPIVSGGQITEQVREKIELRFAILNFRNAFSGFAVFFGAVASIILLCLDIITKPKVKFRKKVLFYFICAAATMLVSLPWSVFDSIYRPADYIIMPLISIAGFTLAMIINICISYKSEIMNWLKEKLAK